MSVWNTALPADSPLWAPPLPDAPRFQHLLVETPGLRTHVAVIGDGEPVVLLHGFPQHWWQWHAVAPRIAAAGHRVICPDLRGAGWTSADSPRVRRQTRLLDLLALLDALQVERAHLISHDMGAITALQLSYRHPEPGPMRGATVSHARIHELQSEAAASFPALASVPVAPTARLAPWNLLGRVRCAPLAEVHSRRPPSAFAATRDR